MKPIVTAPPVALCLSAWIVMTSLTLMTVPAAAQQWRTPPPRSVETMRRAVNLGSDQGFSAKLKAIEITDPEFNPFMVKIDVTGRTSLGLHAARFITDGGEFTTELPPGTKPRYRGAAFLNAPDADSESTLQAREIEERSFNIDVEQARWLAQTSSLEIILIGRLKECSYRLEKRKLEALTTWLLPRLENQP